MAILALVASLFLFVVNAVQFTYKNQQNKTFGLAGVRTYAGPYAGPATCPAAVGIFLHIVVAVIVRS